MSPVRLSRRQVVLLPFPFSDLSASKLRPALVLADAGRGDWLLCQITSQSFADVRAVTLVNGDFVQGGLQLTSYARPAKLFTAHVSLVRTVSGLLSESAHRRVVDALFKLLEEGAVTPD